MSFILDALKKSEIERQRQTVPGLMDASAAPVRKGYPAWAIALAALLAVNLIVLGVVLVRNNAGPSSQGSGMGGDAAGAAGGATAARATAAGSAGVELQPKAAAARPFSPLDPAPGDPTPAEFAPEIPVEQPSEAARPARMPRPPPAPRAGTAHADPRLSDAEPEDQEVLPSISELDLASQGLAELHIDVHVYATNPSDRFVYINMRKYHEGAILQEGPKLERIRRDGAVLSYRGVRFFLPRQS